MKGFVCERVCLDRPSCAPPATPTYGERALAPPMHGSTPHLQPIRVALATLPCLHASHSPAVSTCCDTCMASPGGCTCRVPAAGSTCPLWAPPPFPLCCRLCLFLGTRDLSAAQKGLPPAAAPPAERWILPGPGPVAVPVSAPAAGVPTLGPAGSCPWPRASPSLLL